MTTSLLLVAYVYSLYHVLRMWFDFFDFDVDYFYEKTKPCGNDRPKWQKFLLKPTIYCLYCMSSVHGSFCYFVILQGRDWREWIFSVIVCAGILVLTGKILDRFDI